MAGAFTFMDGGPSFLKDMPAELWVVQEGTLQLRAGCSRTRMQPQNIIHTTSRKSLQKLDDRIEIDKQQHAPCSSIHAPTPRAPRNTRQPGNFTDKVAHALLDKSDVPLLVSEILIGEESSGSSVGHDPSRAVQQLFKRRRLNGKQAVPGPQEAIRLQPQIEWKDIFQEVNSDVPPKGCVYYHEGSPVIASIQTLVPQFVVRHAVFCRGTVRVQGPKAGIDINTIPLRMTTVVKRDTGLVEADGSVEQWTKIPKYHRARIGDSSKVHCDGFRGTPGRTSSRASPESSIRVGGNCRSQTHGRRTVRISCHFSATTTESCGIARTSAST